MLICNCCSKPLVKGQFRFCSRSCSAKITNTFKDKRPKGHLCAKCGVLLKSICLKFCSTNCYHSNIRKFEETELSRKLDDDRKLYTKFGNKEINATKEGIEFILTYNEFCLLVSEANLISSDLGFTGKNYDLARYGDTGPYRIDNCRFISHLENMREKRKRA